MTASAWRFAFKAAGKEMWQQFPVTVCAAVYYTGLQKKDTYDVILCSHIGDFLFTAGYLQEFQQAVQMGRYQKRRKLRLIGVQKFEKLLDYYPGLDCEFLALRPKLLQLILDANRTRAGRAFFEKTGSVHVVEPANAFIDGVLYAFRYPDLNLRMCIQYGVLGLKKNACFARPSYTPKANQDERHQKKKRVLLCASAQVMEIKNIGKYMSYFAEYFTKEDCEVYANGMWEEMPTEKVKSVYWDLGSFFKNCFHIDTVIGVRSGLLDLAACTSAAVIALYPKKCAEGKGCSRFYDIKQIFPEKETNHQYILTGDFSVDVEEILRLTRKRSRE